MQFADYPHTNTTPHTEFRTPSAAEPYFTMLETIHEYARDQLDASSEAQIIRRHHASYFLSFAQRAEPYLRGPQQADWLNRLERERENFRSALDWTYHHDRALGLKLAAALGTFWTRRSHLSEAHEWLSNMLPRAQDAAAPPTEPLAHALFALGFIIWHQGDMQSARPHLQESVRIFKHLRATRHTVNLRVMAEALNILGIVVGRLEGIPSRRPFHEEALATARESGENWSIARSLYQLGHVARMSGDHASAQSHFEESLALFRASGDDFNIGLALIGAGLMAQQRGDYQSSRALFEESLAIFRALGVPWAIASVLYCLGSVALDQGDYAGARSFIDESLVLQRELGTRGDLAEGLENLGRAAFFQGDYSDAYSSYTESLTLFQESGDKYGMALCLMDLAGVMIAASKATRPSSQPRRESSSARHAEDDPSQSIALRGVQLLGAAQALLENIGIQLNQMGRKLLDAYTAAARRRLGEPAFTETIAAGRAMTLDAAIALAHNTAIPRAPGVRKPAPLASRPHAPIPLTRREREIAALLASGKSNRQIADALVMSERTVEWHTGNILSKLDFQSRAQIAVWAVEQGLAQPHC
jgi:DNA-binding CsgD family transcriptional regulator/tetratricopeptide (TPR) repeat protein